MKISSDGRSVIYATYIGGGGLDQLSAIAVDKFGRAHVVGFTESTDYPTTPGAVRTTVQNSEATYSRISADGSTLEYSTLLGGSQTEDALAVAVDDAGDAYVTGFTSSPDFPVLRAFQPSSHTTNGTAFLAKFTDQGLNFATYLGGSTIDEGWAVGVTSQAVYVGGFTESTDFPGASRPANKDSAGFITAITPDGSTLLRTALLDGSGADLVRTLAVNSSDVVYTAGITYSSDFPFSSDAPQKGYAGDGDNFVAVVPMTGGSAGTITWSSYLGGTSEDDVLGMTLDGSGGFMIGGSGSADYPTVNGSTPSTQTEGTATLAHFAAPQPENIVLYAKDASKVVGNWELVSDSTAAGGIRIWNPDAGMPKIATASQNPANYFELTFNASAGIPYHLWMRLRADNDSYLNDSVFVQFSDAIATGGSAHWLIGTTGATVVSLQDCNGCGEQGWGWNDNGYNAVGEPVMFYATGQHTIRIQQREDGVSIDQIVLSSSTWANTAPGANKNDSTIVPQGSAPPPSNQPPTVSLTSPANGTYGRASYVPVEATAKDADGIIERVDFYANSTLVWTDTAAPYRFTFENMPSGNYTLTAVATDNGGATATSAPVSITTTGIDSGTPPPYFDDNDIGAVGVAGSATYGNGTYTVYGSGADVWGTADAVHYTWETLPRDGAIIARVATVSDESNWVKAGVMIRGSLSPDSAQAFMLVSHSKGVCFQRRVADGNASASICGSMSTAPRWVKLVRTDNTIIGYESADGTTWALVGSDEFTTDAPGVYVGLAVSSHIRGTLATATFDNVMVVDAVGPNSPPAVSITSPSAGATFTAPASISIGLNAIDADGGISKIDLYANSTLIGTVAGSTETSSYQFTWSNVPAGSYALTAIATDTGGATTTSSPISITVGDGSSPGACPSLTLSRTFFYSGGPQSTWQITVTAPNSGCTWTASIDQSWLVLNDTAGPTTISGTGSRTVILQTLDNSTGALRNGTFTIGGTAYKVTQEPN